MKRILPRPALLLLPILLCLSLLLATTASANSAQRYWEGVTASGAIVTGGDCPIEVGGEVLTFDIGAFPEPYYESAQAFAAYNARVTAEYTLVNPSENTVHLTLVFPFGRLPLFAKHFDSETNIYRYFDDSDRYRITVDGNEIPLRVRHTLPTTDPFDAAAEVQNISDTEITDPFFSPDTPVTKLVYRVSLDGDADGANVSLDVQNDRAKTRLLLDGMESGSIESGFARVGKWVHDGDPVTVYLIGEATSSHTFLLRTGGSSDQTVQGSVTLENTTALSLCELVLSKRPDDSPVSEVDWYNAAVRSLNENEWEYGVIRNALDADFTTDLLRWYEYALTFAPGQMLVNEVTAPIYPTADAYYDPPTFSYTYLLSPARSFASFGELEILVNTSAYLLDSTLGSFAATDSGYTLILSELPHNELTFTLCASETPKLPSRSSSWQQALPIVLAAALPLCAAITVAVWLAMRRRKANKP